MDERLSSSKATEHWFPRDEGTQQQHAQGTCGSLGPGTGLRDGRGWIVSMLPGHREVSASGGGAACLTAARISSIDFDAGRPYYMVIEGLQARSTLEWKVPGQGWSPVLTPFLYPPQGVAYEQGQ